MELTAKGSVAMTMTATAKSTTALNATQIEATARREATSLQSYRQSIAQCQPIARNRSTLLPSTRNTYSSRIVRNLFKTNEGAASYPQLKQGVRRDSFSREFLSQARKHSTASARFFLPARGQR
jgi:hypothetical protein